MNTPRAHVQVIESIAKLKAAEAVYSRQLCENVFGFAGFGENQGDDIKFQKIDGVLHVNTDVGGMGWIKEFTGQITVKSNEADKIVVAVIGQEPFFDTEDITEVPDDFTLVLEDDDWKLDNWYEHGTSAFS